MTKRTNNHFKNLTILKFQSVPFSLSELLNNDIMSSRFLSRDCLRGSKPSQLSLIEIEIALV